MMTAADLSRRMNRAVFLPLLLMAVVAGALASQVSRLLAAGRGVDHTDRVLARVHRIEKLLVDRETGLRGYRLTGDPAFLQPYLVADGRLPAELGNLTRLVAGDPTQARRVALLREGAAQWSRLNRIAVAPPVSPRPVRAAAALLSRERAGKASMDALRVQFSEFVRAEEALRDRRAEGARLAGGWVLAGAGFTALLAGAFLANVTRRDLAAVAQAHERSLTERGRAIRDLAKANQSLTLANAALAVAYDATLEGWARALELRDRETEGHARRVVEMTLRLAEAAGIEGDELAHVQRGALLHDIGKIGIPDEILMKPGPLTPQEWAVVRRHPVLAYEMLSPVDFLRPALDIPYCHHERWDGSGYPRGLKGEEIPLSARLFAVVDVWDALRSERPYRPAWSEERVRAHIASLAGTHFEPAVVALFLAVM
jgi:CHASE3 domain sensor protein